MKNVTAPWKILREKEANGKEPRQVCIPSLNKGGFPVVHVKESELQSQRQVFPYCWERITNMCVSRSDDNYQLQRGQCFGGPKYKVGANFRPLGSREVVGNVLLYFAFHCVTTKELGNVSFTCVNGDTRGSHSYFSVKKLFI